MLSDSKILSRLILTRFENIAGTEFFKSTLSLEADIEFDENTKSH